VERIHVFQHAESIDAGNAGVPEPQVLGRWLPLDESAEGFKLQRCVPGARVKVGNWSLCVRAARNISSWQQCAGRYRNQIVQL
jgi:hypothetical protein